MMLLILYTLSFHPSLSIFLSLSVGETGVSVCIRVHMLIPMCSRKLVYLRMIFYGECCGGDDMNNVKDVDITTPREYHVTC